MILFRKKIKYFGGYSSVDCEKKMEDFFACNCTFDNLFKLLHSEEEINYHEMVEIIKIKFPDHLIFDFFEVSILMCKETFLYYRKIRNSDFSSEKCCVHLFKIDGFVIGVCVICLMKDIMKNSMIFFNHFKLIDKFRSNGTYLYMQLPIRTDDGDDFPSN